MSAYKDGKLRAAEAHDATRCCIDGFLGQLWIASFRDPDNKLVVEEFSSRAEALDWLETQARVRGLKYARPQ
jgi:hypothetical protein